MSKHLFGLVVTPLGTAANNRGETEGNITTLQKILWQGEVHTTVSAEAIRWALRRYWQLTGGEESVNRRWKEEGDKPSHVWADHGFEKWERFIDDDVLGFMSAEAAKEETNESEKATPKKGRPRGKTLVRRARLEVTRALSLTPFAGDMTFNAASVGATPSASKTGKDPVPYGTEVHATRYQYGFALTPEDLSDKSRALLVLDAIVNMSEVAGNQARFLFDFSPDSIVLRWTDDFAPRFLYGFQTADGDRVSAQPILDRIDSGDIAPEELVVGGSLAGQPYGQELKEKGASVLAGVKAAVEEIKRRMRDSMKIKTGK